MSQFGSAAEAPLISRPYSERQLITVVSDAAAAVERKAAATEKGADWTTALEIARRKAVGKGAEWRDKLRTAKDADSRSKLKVAASLAGLAGLVAVAPPVAGAAVAVGGVSTLALLGGRELRKLIKVNQLRGEGVHVLPVGSSEAKALTFPVGHPRDRVLYAGHPAIPTVYYTAALFHSLTFEHKFSEAVRMLTTLGATQFEVERVSGWSSELATNLSIPLATTGVQGGAEADRTKSSESRILFTATLSGNESPALPEDLVWYPHEPLWQEVAEARLHHGLKEFNLTVRYEDDYGINAGLKLAVEQIGFDMGGNFVEHQSTVWRIVGTFGKPASATANRQT